MVRIASDAIYLSLTSLGLASFWLFDKGIVAAVDTAGTGVDTGVTALRSSRIPIILRQRFWFRDFATFSTLV